MGVEMTSSFEDAATESDETLKARISPEADGVVESAGLLDALRAMREFLLSKQEMAGRQDLETRRLGVEETEPLGPAGIDDSR